MNQIKGIILSTTIAAVSLFNITQPAQAQTRSQNIAGRWQCRITTRGLIKSTQAAASIEDMIIDASSDGRFQSQSLVSTGYGNWQVFGEGNWQIDQNFLLFKGQGQSLNPQFYGMSVPVSAMGQFIDANNISANFNDGKFANSYYCSKI